MIFRDLKGFTLVEVLITLGVIGVVSAVTLPTFISKIKDEQYDRARQKVLSTVGEAVRQVAVDGNLTSANDAKDFVENYLSKKLKIIKTCETTNASNLSQCGFSSKIKKLGTSTKINIPTLINNNTSHSFILSNGYSIDLFYNPNCISTLPSSHYALGYICVNVVYDMNGLHNPNQVGKDIGFVSVLYPNETSRIIAPNPAPNDAGQTSWNEAEQLCRNINKSYSLPNMEELLALAYNKPLLNFKEQDYLSSSVDKNMQNYAITVGFHTFSLGSIIGRSKTSQFPVRCIKR